MWILLNAKSDSHNKNTYMSELVFVKFVVRILQNVSDNQNIRERFENVEAMLVMDLEVKFRQFPNVIHILMNQFRLFQEDKKRRRAQYVIDTNKKIIGHVMNRFQEL